MQAGPSSSVVPFTTLPTEVLAKKGPLDPALSTAASLLAVKDAHITALQTELRGRDRILQAKPKVTRIVIIIES